MSRVKWYQLDISDTVLDLFTRHALANRYSGDSPNGFVVSEVRKGLLDARFVRRTVVEGKVVDPMGVEYTTREVRVETTNFRVDRSRSWLRVLNAPRSLKPFVAAISIATDFEFALDPMEFPIHRWLAELRGSGWDGSYRKAVFSAVPHGERAVAKIGLAGTISEAEMDEHNERYGADKLTAAKVILSSNSQVATVELRKGASASISGDPDWAMGVLEGGLERLR